MGSHPDRVKMVGRSIYQPRFIGQNARFKVAFPIAFHADTGTCQVCRTDVGNLTVENQDLEMNSRTQPAFQTTPQGGVSVEIRLEVRPRFFGVHQPYLHAPPYQNVQHRKEGFATRSDLYVQILDVGRADPQRVSYEGHATQNFIIMGRISYIVYHPLLDVSFETARPKK